MGRVYIKGGTPAGSTSLCKTCTSAHIMTGFRESEMVAICTDVHPNAVLPFAVNECTGYYDKNRPSWAVMEKFALDVVPSPLKPVGFKVGIGFERESTLRKPAEDEDDD